MNSRKGRPRRSGQDPRGEGRSYWLGEVFIDQGWTWSTELVEVDPVDDRRRWQALPLCLGREDDIVPILKGHEQMPEDMHPRRGALLLSILEVNKYGGKTNHN